MGRNLVSSSGGFKIIMKGLGARFIRIAICLWLVLSINFALPRLIPGDPLLMLLGPDAAILSQKDYASLKTEYGLDRPLLTQYLSYWSDLAKGRLGYSFHNHRPVTQLILEHLWRSLSILLPSLGLSVLGAMIGGTAAGWKSGTMADIGLTGLALVGNTMPGFLLAMILLDIFGYRLALFPLSGFFSNTGPETFTWSRLTDIVRHVTLPILTLTSTFAAGLFLIMRNGVSRSIEEPYVLYARARGIAPWRIPFLHILPNACLPFLNMAALHLGFLVSGAVLVETVFSIKGMGILIFDAAMNRDFPVLQGCFLMLSIVVMVLNLLVDSVAGWIDPRIRRPHENA